MTILESLSIVSDEAIKINTKLGEESMAKSPHKGYALILEELDEAWIEIKANNIERSIEEMKQVAATAIRYIHQMSNV